MEVNEFPETGVGGEGLGGTALRYKRKSDDAASEHCRGYATVGLVLLSREASEEPRITAEDLSPGVL